MNISYLGKRILTIEFLNSIMRNSRKAVTKIIGLIIQLLMKIEVLY